MPPISPLLRDASLIGVCSRDLDKAKAFQTEFRAERAYSDLDAMLADPGIDVIYVATPNALHAEQALRAIAAGKSVLVEKPLATSVSDAERIGREAAAKDCFVMEAMWTRFLPAVRAAGKLAGTGAIGEIRMIRAELSYRRNEDAGSRFFRPDLGGGAALDLGVYPVSLALHFLGRPSTVSGRTVASKSGVDMRSEFSLGFAGGARAELSCGFDRDGGNQFVIEGSEGVLVLDAPFLKAQRLLRFSPRAYAMMPKVEGRRGSCQARATAAAAGPARPALSVSGQRAAVRGGGGDGGGAARRDGHRDHAVEREHRGAAGY